MLLQVLAIAGALLLIERFVPGISVDSFTTAIIVAVVWGVLSFTVKPLLNLVALPINLLTFGLFSFVINALLFWFMAAFVPGFEVTGFIPALEGSVLLAVVGLILHALL